MSIKNLVLGVVMFSLLTSTSWAGVGDRNRRKTNQIELNELRRQMIEEFDVDADGELSERESAMARRAVLEFLDKDGLRARDKAQEVQVRAALKVLLQRPDSYSAPRLSKHDSTPATAGSFPNSPPEAIHRHSSTAAEGWLRGRAVLLQAFGNYVLQRSQAAVLWEHSESLQYDNYLKRGQTAFARKRMVYDYRDYKRQVRRDRQETAQQLWEAKYIELAHRYRLDEYQFNFATGAIYWPTIAAGPQYAQHRQNISLLIDDVVRYGAAEDPVLRDRIAKACERFRNQLHKDAAEDAPSMRDEYLAMQRFLVGLKYTPYLMLGDSSTTQHLTMN